MSTHVAALWQFGHTKQMRETREKPIVFVGSSREDLLEFPQDVRRNVGFAPGIAQ